MTKKMLLEGNEAIVLGAIHCGCDAYFGYPITPQSEILEKLVQMKPWETTGMVVIQAESELASINMVYGGASCGKKVMTSSSGLGISLMCEGISYIAGAELPCLIVNVMRGGPGLGTIQPSQGDYFQAVKGGGHGDYKMLVLAPASVQEMYDFVSIGFDLAFKYRNPVMILSDGMIGQMMEKMECGIEKKRWTQDEIEKLNGSWATIGKPAERNANIITSLDLEPLRQEAFNEKLQEKYRAMQRDEVLCEQIDCEDAQYVFIAYGSSARICQKAMELARLEGLKVGLLRPITLFPFPEKEIQNLIPNVEKFITVEMSVGQMLEDVRLAVFGAKPVLFYGRTGGVVPTAEEILDFLKGNI